MPAPKAPWSESRRDRKPFEKQEALILLMLFEEPRLQEKRDSLHCNSSEKGKEWGKEPPAGPDSSL